MPTAASAPVAAHALRAEFLAAVQRAVRHVDVGGEGRYAAALNVNPYTVTTTTAPASRRIPNLVRGRAEAIPLASGSVDLLTMENAPLRPGAAQELARVLSHDGEAWLLHPADYARTAHAQAAEAIRGTVSQARVGESLLTRITRAADAQPRSSTAP